MSNKTNNHISEQIGSNKDYFQRENESIEKWQREVVEAARNLINGKGFDNLEINIHELIELFKEEPKG